MKTKTLISIIIVIIIILASAGYLYYDRNHQRGTGKTTAGQGGNSSSSNNITITLPLSVGAKVFINATAITGNETLNNNITLTVSGYQWPFLNATFQADNQTHSVLLVYTSLEVPENVVGEKSFNAPIAAPIVGEGLCATFNLTGKGDGWYTYSSTINVGTYTINVTAVILDNGTYKNVTYTFTGYNPENKSQRVNVKQIIKIKILNNNPSGATISYNPSQWFCKPPISSDLRFVWDGIILLQKGSARMVSIDQLLQAMDKGAYVAFLNKGCPHCMRTWPHLYQAVQETGTPVYIVVFGNLMNITQYKYFTSTMTLNGLTGYPAIAYFKGGTIPGPQYRLVGEIDNTTVLVSFLSKKP